MGSTEKEVYQTRPTGDSRFCGAPRWVVSQTPVYKSKGHKTLVFVAFSECSRQELNLRSTRHVFWSVAEVSDQNWDLSQFVGRTRGVYAEIGLAILRWVQSFPRHVGRVTLDISVR
jgi:hypothetical protein